ncbi:MAG TPA: glycosyltransferase, partial [Candidatus Woesebacteria bacterium]|nr:glycosyltransferase [Candidatus Woesebacteria bacterium]
MEIPLVILILFIFVLGMLLITLLGRDLKESVFTVTIVLLAVALFSTMQVYHLVLVESPKRIYVVLGLINYIVTFLSAEIFYKDPVKDFVGDEISFKKKKKVRFCVSVYKEEGFIGRCIQSIVDSAEFAKNIAEVEIFVVNDASPDDTWEKLQKFSHLPDVHLINLQKNVGKKGGLAAAMTGGEKWYEIYEWLISIFGKLKPIDIPLIMYHLREQGFQFSQVDYFLHTDSDSVVSQKFIKYMIYGFESDKNLGAISGHCDVWIDESPSFVTKMQIAWYYTQFRIRKAAESVYGAVFCVSGPGAGFRSEAILHTLYDWVFDTDWTGKVYRGATDRKLTLLVLKGNVVIDNKVFKNRWRIKYSALAQVRTVVPDTFEGLRSQWTRWKQNFFHVLGEVVTFAWKVNPLAAFLVYSHLIITIVGPFLVAYHLILAFVGGIWASLLYLLGILLVGSLMSMGYLVNNPT